MSNPISEKELLEMTAADYMNDSQLSYFKSLLELQKETIISGIAKLKKDLIITDKSADQADAATNHELQQLELKRMNREASLLNKINDSLRLIKSGDYGYCEDTGEEIGIKRLLARPTSTLCVEAKELQEFRERTVGI